MSRSRTRDAKRLEREAPVVAPAAAPRSAPRGSCPVVGIGASAGGLEALEGLLSHVPDKSGMALVVVQHLDPKHKGMMVELLQRATSMEVVQVKDRLRVEPNRVYVIPPNADMSILHGVLHLLEPAAPRGLRLPVDFFFRSLADEQKERSVGVILSGMGLDGTLGVRAIKEQAGAVFVQAPASAKFDGMPRSVIDAGLADVVYISGRTGKYLEPAAGKANWNIHAMAREGLRYELSSAFQRALRHKSAVTHARIKVCTNEGAQAVDVTVAPIQEPEALRGSVMVVFADVATPLVADTPSKASKTRPTPAALARTARELGQVREELQTTHEQMQASQEERESANEELQSTNEELTTSKEEMQSLNEELQMLNHELLAKVDELSRANNDMRNLLDSTDIATLFLDDGLKVRRFTAQMAKLIKLIPSDVDRPITDLASDLIYPELCEDAREVLRSLVFQEKPVTTRDGRLFSVRTMPYRTLDNRIDGVVITFTDISAAKILEATLSEAKSGHEVEQ